MPLKRHWRNFRAYSDCFAANEAIEWLYRYLKTSHNFKSQTSITRQLLQIFLKERIIEDVRGDKYNSKEFQDDDRLFKYIINFSKCLKLNLIYFFKNKILFKR